MLLITGNDIMPQTPLEVLNCTFFLLFGAVFVVFIRGNISAEIKRAQDQVDKFQNTYNYVFFSM